MPRRGVITTIGNRTDFIAQMRQDLELFAALYEDVQNGVVWFNATDPKLTSRSVVRITNPSTGKSIYCEALSVDHNFVDRYNSRFKRNYTESPSTFSTPKLMVGEPAIVMSEWYRRKLGIQYREGKVSLEIDCPSRWCAFAKLRACCAHPQTVVRVATWLGVTSVALGVVGVGLGWWALVASR